MNILVTGANGQLGNELRVLASGSGDRFVFTDVNDIPGVETTYLDITNADAVRIVAESERPDVIINCAAFTNVDGAEDNVGLAGLLNRDAVANLAEAARLTKATLIHISTDYVFSGTGCVPVKETEEPCPRSVYGRTKLEGEKAVKDSGCRSIIIRTAWLYSPFGKNFVKTIRRLVEAGGPLKVVYDQVGTPTYAADLAAFIMHIIRTGQLSKTGIYHFTDEGAVSWFDFACAIRDLCGKKDVMVNPCLTDEFPAKADRPRYSVLDKSKAKETFGFGIPYWRDSLEACFKRM